MGEEVVYSKKNEAPKGRGKKEKTKKTDNPWGGSEGGHVKGWFFKKKGSPESSEVGGEKKKRKTRRQTKDKGGKTLEGRILFG